MENLTNLLRKIFIGSVAGIAASNTINAHTKNETFNINLEEYKTESVLNRKSDLSPKLILKKTNNDEWAFVSHRSHRSHSSHRSHYSSYSGGSKNESTTKSNPGLKPNNDTNNNNNNISSPTNPSPSTALQLGTRTLKKGMSGTDVTELVNILLRKKYLILDDGSMKVTGSLTFDEIIEGAVKKFQTDNGLTNDGICDSTTIYYLKNK